MRALDSNILLRYITQDDSAQTTVATRFIDEELTLDSPGFIALPVICEVAWSLRQVYRFPREHVAQAILRLQATQQIVLAHEALVSAALVLDAEFVDALIHVSGRLAGCAETVTFDRRFARLSGVRLLSQ